MAFPIRDCECEDFPLCEHADNYPAEPEYCDMCGYTYVGPTCPCERYDPSEDEDDEEDEDE